MLVSFVMSPFRRAATSASRVSVLFMRFLELVLEETMESIDAVAASANWTVPPATASKSSSLTSSLNSKPCFAASSTNSSVQSGFSVASFRKSRMVPFMVGSLSGYLKSAAKCCDVQCCLVTYHPTPRNEPARRAVAHGVIVS